MSECYYKYAYEGPIMVFEKCITSNWKSETAAPSERKAKSNLVYQAKKACNLSPGAKLTLPGKIKMVE